MQINQLFEPGDKIQYRMFDKKGKAYWLDGEIHSVRRYEDPKTNFVVNQTYLVDTGRDLRVDKYHFDHRDREINKRVNILTTKGKTIAEAIQAVSQHTDLPDSKLEVEHVRQPLQIELPAEHIRAA